MFDVCVAECLSLMVGIVCMRGKMAVCVLYVTKMIFFSASIRRIPHISTSKWITNCIFSFFMPTQKVHIWQHIKKILTADFDLSRSVLLASFVYLDCFYLYDGTCHLDKHMVFSWCFGINHLPFSFLEFAELHWKLFV